MLLTYILNLLSNFVIEFTLVEIHPKLLKFLEDRGEFQASNGVKIYPGSRLMLGPADGVTGYPRYIKGIGLGLNQLSNKGSTFFDNNEYRAQYAYGLRIALAELVHAYKYTVDGYEYTIPYVVVLQ